MTRSSRRDGPDSSGSHRAGQRGFALLAALLALLALSILAAAGVFVARSEGRISRSHAATVRAREVARSGLSEYLASGSVVAGETRAFVHGRDTAVVTAARLLHVTADGARTLLRLTSRGVRVRAGRPNAERVLATVVLRDDSLSAGGIERPGTRHVPGAP